MLNKITKIAMWVLMAIGVLLTAGVFLANDAQLDGRIDLLLKWGFVMLILAVLAIVYGIGRDSRINPKNLISIAIVLVGGAVLVGIAYVLAPGTPAVGYVGAPVSDGALKLTDTILNLTYIALAASVIVIVASVVIDAIKSKK